MKRLARQLGVSRSEFKSIVTPIHDVVGQPSAPRILELLVEPMVDATKFNTVPLDCSTVAAYVNR